MFESNFFLAIIRFVISFLCAFIFFCWFSFVFFFHIFCSIFSVVVGVENVFSIFMLRKCKEQCNPNDWLYEVNKTAATSNERAADISNVTH